MSSTTETIKPAELLKQVGPYLIPGKLKVTEWTFRVPLIHSEPSGETIRLFARSAEKAEAGHIHESKTSSNGDKGNGSNGSTKPWVFYLSGGPGGAVPAPQDAGYVRFFLDKGYNVMLLDQRGAGLSSTVSARTLAQRGDAASQAAYLKLFRADNIVRDFEAVRLTVTKDLPNGNNGEKRKIALMGQSFGGFCSTTYLSMFPHALREVFMTGGLPPMGRDIDEIYTSLVRRSAERSKAFYEKFPDDEKRTASVVQWIKEQESKGSVESLQTLSGGKLSEARFRAIGMSMGAHGGFTRMHNLLVRMENDMETHGYWTRPTMTAFENMDSFDDMILYAIVHEIIYLDGPGKASDWSAERVLKASSDYGQAPADHPVFFTGEMITHETFTDHTELRGLLEVAEILYADKEWPKLYNEEVLAKNSVPVFCAVYYDDLFVDFDFSRDTASKIKGAKIFVTNRAYHDGLRSDTNKILDELFALRDNTLD